MASARKSSSAFHCSCSGLLNWNVQPPCLKPSAPPGSSITPSRETNSETTILPMVTLSLSCCRVWRAVMPRRSHALHFLSQIGGKLFERPGKALPHRFLRVPEGFALLLCGIDRPAADGHCGFAIGFGKRHRIQYLPRPDGAKWSLGDVAFLIRKGTDEHHALGGA